MTEFLELKVTDCKHCYKCIRNCPVKAIRFSDNQAAIMQEECVLCGRCFVSCPQNAKRIHSDLAKAQELVASGVPVYASIAPSFVANYAGATIQSIKNALQALGFAGVSETAKGATLVKQQYDAIVEKGEKEVIISTCCHTVDMLVEKYFPNALPYMAGVISPMQANASSIRKEHPDAKVVFIGPCISKKAEAARYPESLDCALTFAELDAWLAEKDVHIAAEEDSSPEETGKARLFPVPGGILRSMEKRNQNYHYIAVDGIDNCIEALRDVTAGGLSHCFIEMSACTGSCIGGPAMSHTPGLVRGTCQVNAYASKTDFVVPALEDAEMQKQLSFDVLRRPRFGEKAVEGVLRKIGKNKKEDELNCGSCGYDTCRDKAAAVLEGKANLEMCLPYLMNKAQSFSDTIISNTPNGIIVLNESLQVQQLNHVACQILNIKRAEDILGQNIACLMDPFLFSQVLEDGAAVYDSRQYLAEYGKYIELTVVCDASYGVVIGVMRDTTESETARVEQQKVAEKSMRVADEVIEKQMRTVQEIASLLGETAAETKIALTKLKETLRDD